MPPIKFLMLCLLTSVFSHVMILVDELALNGFEC
jgi:hypothetical protein